MCLESNQQINRLINHRILAWLSAKNNSLYNSSLKSKSIEDGKYLLYILHIACTCITSWCQARKWWWKVLAANGPLDCYFSSTPLHVCFKLSRNLDKEMFISFITNCRVRPVSKWTVSVFTFSFKGLFSPVTTTIKGLVKFLYWLILTDCIVSVIVAIIVSWSSQTVLVLWSCPATIES